MCKTFDDLWSKYLDGVRAGEACFKLREVMSHTANFDRFGQSYREVCAEEHLAHVQVQKARLLIETHRRECGECRLALSARTLSRARVDDVDPAEFSEPPLLAMMEARG